MRRLWGYLDRCLADPAPEGLGRWLARHVPAEARALTSARSPTTAMVLAAGLGTRMRPLTDDRPKALVEVAGRTLIDHVLDRLEAVGIARVVVNVHALADRLEGHLARRTDLEVILSDERGGLLETGGGLKKARPLLGNEPILVANIDSVWIDEAALRPPDRGLGPGADGRSVAGHSGGSGAWL